MSAIITMAIMWLIWLPYHLYTSHFEDKKVILEWLEDKQLEEDYLAMQNAFEKNK